MKTSQLILAAAMTSLMTPACMMESDLNDLEMVEGLEAEVADSDVIVEDDAAIGTSALLDSQRPVPTRIEQSDIDNRGERVRLGFETVGTQWLNNTGAAAVSGLDGSVATKLGNVTQLTNGCRVGNGCVQITGAAAGSPASYVQITTNSLDAKGPAANGSPKLMMSTVAFWLQVNNVPSAGRIFYRGSTLYSHVELTTQDMRFHFRGATDNVRRIGNWVDTAWHHYAIRTYQFVEGGLTKVRSDLFKDGDFVAGGEVTSGVGFYTYGWSYDGAGAMNGWIQLTANVPGMTVKFDDVAIYRGVALADSEIEALANPVSDVTVNLNNSNSTPVQNDGIGTDGEFVQSYTAPQNTTLRAAEICAWTTSSSSAAPTQMQLRSGSTVLATATSIVDTGTLCGYGDWYGIGQYRWHRATFPVNSLTAGTQYGISMSRGATPMSISTYMSSNQATDPLAYAGGEVSANRDALMKLTITQ